MAAAPVQVNRDRPLRRVRDRNLAVPVLAGLVRNWFADSGTLRSQLLTSLWIELKRHGAQRIQNIELSRIRGMDEVRVDGPVRRHSPLVVTALSMLLECEAVFQFGSDTGETTWLLAHNLPEGRVFILDGGTDRTRDTRSDLAGHADRPATGRRMRLDQSEASRVTRLSGDSSSFDFLPYSGTADLVYIEGAKRYDHLRSDTEAAFGLLSELGSIVWDGYSGDPGVYDYLNELAPSLDRPVFHLLGTRLALYSRWDIVIADA